MGHAQGDMADAYRQDATNCRPIPTNLDNAAAAVPEDVRAEVEATAEAEAPEATE